MARRFQVGDEVMLVKTFRCHGDDEEFDRELDKKVREHFANRGVIISDSSTWQGYDGYSVQWGNENEHQASYYVDDEVLGLITPPMTEEEEAAFLAETFGIRGQQTKG